MYFTAQHPAYLGALDQRCAKVTFLCPCFVQTVGCGIGISTDFPSLTPLGLSLGPDLPWADEPSPGILRFSADKFLTCLFVYLYWHSLLYSLHYILRFSFNGDTMLPYRCSKEHPKASVADLSPGIFSAQNPWTSELLRTL